MTTWTVHHGDCLEFLRTLPAGSVDAVVTDPPYSSGGQFRGDRMQSTRAKYQSSDVQKAFASFSGDNRDQRSFGYWCALWLGECRRLVVPGGMLCVFTDWRQLPTVTDIVQAAGWVWRGVAVWDKVVARPVPNRFRQQAEFIVWATNGPRDMDTKNDPAYIDGVLRVTTPPTADRSHATQKPVTLIERILPVCGPAGGTILDPFTGSGTTGVACVQTGRKFIGCEIDEKYVEIARRRIAEAVPLTQEVA